MSTRKSVQFNDETTVSLFFLNQATDIQIEHFKAAIVTEQEEPIPIPAICSMYNLSEDEDDFPESPEPTSYINYTNMCDISSVDCHFFLFINKPGEYVSNLIKYLQDFFSSSNIHCFHIVRPIKHTDSNEDFTISYQGIVIGLTFAETEFCREFITLEKDLVIPGISQAKLIPGPRGEHIWSKHQISRSFLQGFFFVGQDPVDTIPENLCYLVSIPKGMRQDMVRREIYSHCKENPVHIIFNPVETKFVLRLEFAKSEIVKLLMKRCMAFDGKSVIVAPCLDRTPVENLFINYQVLAYGYTNAINPKEFLRVLNEMFGHVAELNIYFEGLDSLILFQTENAAFKCLQKKELFLKNHKIRFVQPSKPFGLSGKKIHRGVYKTKTPDRPLPLMPAPYIYEL